MKGFSREGSSIVWSSLIITDFLDQLPLLVPSQCTGSQLSWHAPGASLQKNVLTTYAVLSFKRYEKSELQNQTHSCVLSHFRPCNLSLEILTRTVNLILQSVLYLCWECTRDSLYPWQRLFHFTCHWLASQLAIMDRKRWPFNFSLNFSDESEALMMSWRKRNPTFLGSFLQNYKPKIKTKS